MRPGEIRQATPAVATTTLDELDAWCAPPDQGGNPPLCQAYLDSGLELLAADAYPLLFHCTARTLYAGVMGKSEELNKAFASAPPSAGFNVFFEIYSGFQINTTLTTLAFGSNDA